MKLCLTSAQNHLTNSKSPSIYSVPEASCALSLYLPLYVSPLFLSSLLYCALLPSFLPFSQPCSPFSHGGHHSLCFTSLAA